MKRFSSVSCTIRCYDILWNSSMFYIIADAQFPVFPECVTLLAVSPYWEAASSEERVQKK